MCSLLYDLTRLIRRQRNLAVFVSLSLVCTSLHAPRLFGQEPTVLKGHTGDVASVTFSSDHRLLASAAIAIRRVDGKFRAQTEVIVWDVAKKNKLWSAGSYGASLAFSPDGKTLAIGSSLREGDVVLVESTTGKLLRKFKNGGSDVVFSANGRILISASGSGTIHVWEVATGKQLRAITAFKGNLKSMDISPDGRTLASVGNSRSLFGGFKQEFKLWDLKTGDLKRTATLKRGGMDSVAFSPDGKTLATTSAKSGDVALVDASSGKQKLVIKNASDSAGSLAFSQSGKAIIATIYTAIVLWDTKTGKIIRSIKGQKDRIGCATISPDGMLLASGSDDQSILIWSVAEILR